jgi:hypothetical protein
LLKIHTIKQTLSKISADTPFPISVKFFHPFIHPELTQTLLH